MELYNVIKIYANYSYQFLIEFNMDDNNYVHKCNSENEFTYDYLVDVFIQKKYNNSQMQAIINNYLLDSTNAKYLKEFEEMQEYRKVVKQFCKDILSFPCKTL